LTSRRLSEPPRPLRRAPCRDDDLCHGRRHRLGDDVAGYALQAGAQVVEHEEQCERNTDTDHQHQQRVAALAGQHPVEHLQHEQRRHKQQQVDEEGQARCVEERAAQQLEQCLHDAFISNEPCPTSCRTRV